MEKKMKRLMFTMGGMLVWGVGLVLLSTGLPYTLSLIVVMVSLAGWLVGAGSAYSLATGSRLVLMAVKDETKKKGK